MKQAEKKQSSHKTILIVALLLVLLLLLSFGGYTLAKYITKGTGSDTATVAKWGFTVTANADDLFGEKYDASGAITTGDTGLSVKADSGNVVAPGTGGSMTVGIDGTAEVLAQISFELEITDVKLPGTIGDGTDDYLPIKWTLKRGETPIVESKSAAELVTEVNKLTQTLEIGQEFTDTYTISWAWAFDGQDDAKDTELGQIAAGEKTVDNAVTEISFNLEITVEQIRSAT